MSKSRVFAILLIAFLMTDAFAVASKYTPLTQAQKGIAMGNTLGGADKAKEVTFLQRVLAEGYGNSSNSNQNYSNKSYHKDEKRCKIKTCRHSYCKTIGAFTDSCTSLLILGSGSGRSNRGGRGGY